MLRRVGERMDGWRVGERMDGWRVGERMDGWRVGERMDGWGTCSWRMAFSSSASFSLF